MSRDIPCHLCRGRGRLEVSHPAEIVDDQSIRDIIISVAYEAGLRVGDLTGPGRQKRIVAARDRCAYRLRTELELPLKTIGTWLNRDHSTIIHALKKCGIEAAE